MNIEKILSYCGDFVRSFSEVHTAKGIVISQEPYSDPILPIPNTYYWTGVETSEEVFHVDHPDFYGFVRGDEINVFYKKIFGKTKFIRAEKC